MCDKERLDGRLNCERVKRLPWLPQRTCRAWQKILDTPLARWGACWQLTRAMRLRTTIQDQRYHHRPDTQAVESRQVVQCQSCSREQAAQPGLVSLIKEIGFWRLRLTGWSLDQHIMSLNIHNGDLEVDWPAWLFN